jgi:hypothetical protein
MGVVYTSSGSLVPPYWTDLPERVARRREERPDGGENQ